MIPAFCGIAARPWNVTTSERPYPLALILRLPKRYTLFGLCYVGLLIAFGVGRFLCHRNPLMICLVTDLPNCIFGYPLLMPSSLVYRHTRCVRRTNSFHCPIRTIRNDYFTKGYERYLFREYLEFVLRNKYWRVRV